VASTVDPVDTAQPDDTSEVGARQPGPIFVVGSMRSGSTMLRLILDSHPHIAVGAETGFVGALLAAKRIPNWRYGGEWYQRIGWSEAELDARLHEFYSGMFQRHAARQGKRRWGEKTPFHTAHMATMAQVFPEAVFVGIVRHPGAVAASLRDNFHYAFPDAVSYWSAINLDMVRAATALGDRFVLCRYEDLVSESERVLRALVGWLGEPWSPDVLAHHRVQREKGAPRVVDGSTITRDRIDASRAESWRRSAAPADHDALEGAAALAGFLGYESRTGREPDGVVTDTPDQVWLSDGADLARRREVWRDRVDFDHHPPTLPIDASAEELAERLARVERALERVRSRRAVRAADALRKAQHARSLRDLQDAWTGFRDLRR
jgi:hypothetical protein